MSKGTKWIPPTERRKEEWERKEKEGRIKLPPMGKKPLRSMEERMILRQLHGGKLAVRVKIYYLAEDKQWRLVPGKDFRIKRLPNAGVLHEVVDKVSEVVVELGKGLKEEWKGEERKP